MKILFYLVLVVLLSCNNSDFNSHENQKSLSAESVTPQKNKPTSISSNNYNENRKVIWNANIELQVDNVNQATSKITELAKTYKAFVSDMDMSTTTYKISNKIKLRVESASFNQIIPEIEKIAKFVRSVSISSNDVTEEYIDTESRLKTKKEVRERYIKILKHKTGKISEVLEAEEAIRKITEEIEAKEARLRYLSDQVKYSTIEVLLFETVEYQETPSVYKKTFLDKAKIGFENGWSMVTGIFILLINIWPFIIILFVVMVWKRKWLYKKLVK